MVYVRDTFLCRHGHVARSSDLVKTLGRPADLDMFAMAPHIVRPRRGMYACAHLSPFELAALELGGVADCVSALSAAELIEPVAQRENRLLHIRLPRGAGRASAGLKHGNMRGEVAVHWARLRVPLPTAAECVVSWRRHGPSPQLTGARVSVLDALHQALTCCVPLADAPRLIDEALDSAHKPDVHGELIAALRELPRILPARVRVPLAQLLAVRNHF